MNQRELTLFLEEKVNQYNQSSFIEKDPIQIPHQFSDPEDIAIAGFCTATISWGQRTTIIKNAKKWMRIMGDSPHDFTMTASDKQLDRFRDFKHRTFNGQDAVFFIQALRSIYKEFDSLEIAFKMGIRDVDKDLFHALIEFRKRFLIPANTRTSKHVANPKTGSASKRLNMFLRWMCRKDQQGVDLGMWSISPSLLSCPLDVHSGRVARHLGLLNRKQNDWKAVQELDFNLRKMDANDPVKYDFALFGLGVFEDF